MCEWTMPLEDFLKKKIIHYKTHFFVFASFSDTADYYLNKTKIEVWTKQKAMKFQ